VARTSDLVRRVLGRPRGHAPEAPEGALDGIRTRLDRLEAQLEGLQDAMHRESTRQNEQLADHARRLDPAELTKALSQHARDRGIE
jgi:hypothetical protein